MQQEKQFIYGLDTGIWQTVWMEAVHPEAGIAETANGYIAADGNMREFYFWSKDGTLLAEVDCYDMFGTRYPWIEDMKVAEDGSVMVLMTQDRDDDSASELMVFRLTGF